MTKINKSRARKEFNKGTIIYLLPSKISEQVAQFSPWFSMIKIKKNDYLDEAADFDRIVNSFEYYNCNYNTGYRATYYIY